MILFIKIVKKINKENKMKKILILTVVISLILGVFGCKKSDKKRSSSDGVKALKDRGVFVLGLDDSFPPLGFRNENNEIVGYDIDLAKEVAKRLGVEFKAQPIDWDAKEMELETGNIDCIWNGFTITEQRKEALSMSEPYLNNDQVLVVRKDSGINSLEGMAGKIVGVQSGSTAQEAIEGNSEFYASLKEVVKFKDNITALNDLDIGGIDGVVMDSVVANYSIMQTQKPFIVIKKSLASEFYGIGFRKNESDLKDAVEDILSKMNEDGTLDSIYKKWFGN